MCSKRSKRSSKPSRAEGPILRTRTNIVRRASSGSQGGALVASARQRQAADHRQNNRRRNVRDREVQSRAQGRLPKDYNRPALDKGGWRPVPFAYELIATFLLTGGRESEVLGIEVDDVSLDRAVVTFRPNKWRRLKTATSHRSVPLWPQLREALEHYLAEQPPSRLLFPSYRTGEEAMLTDFRKLLDAVAVRAGWKVGEIRSKMFRHTYCAARLQTVDQGAPVSTYTVAREMGHGGEAMVRKVYGHLGQVRHRAEAVEYRVEQHLAKLGARLEALRGVGFGTTIGTTA